MHPAMLPPNRRDGSDFWPTPGCLRAALVDHVLPRAGVSGVIWEPAAGEGHLVRELTSRHRIIATDKTPGAPGIAERDFLKPPMPREAFGAWVITNPPYNALDAFLRRGVDLMDGGDIAGSIMLLRNDHIAGGERSAVLNRAALLVHCNWRPTWVPGTTVTGRFSNIWAVWSPEHEGPPRSIFLDGRGMPRTGSSGSSG
jgi:hypothetical protein